VPKASENVSFYRGSERRYSHNPKLRAGRIPPHDQHSHKITTKNLAVRTLPIYKYIAHKEEFLLLEVLNLYNILPNVILAVSPPSIFLIRFRTRIIRNILYTKTVPSYREEYLHMSFNIQGVSGGIINILGGGSMDYSE